VRAPADASISSSDRCAEGVEVAGGGGGSEKVDLGDLQRELVAAKRELWKERLKSDAIRSANKKVDEAMGLALANEKARVAELEEEYLSASLKIKGLEDMNR
jgi:hypothetical protein